MWTTHQSRPLGTAQPRMGFPGSGFGHADGITSVRTTVSVPAYGRSNSSGGSTAEPPRGHWCAAVPAAALAVVAALADELAAAENPLSIPHRFVSASGQDLWLSTARPGHPKSAGLLGYSSRFKNSLRYRLVYS